VSSPSTSGHDSEMVHSITTVRRGTRSRCRKPSHTRRGRSDPAHSRAERWDGRRQGPRCRTRRPGSDTTAVAAVNEGRGGALLGGEGLCRPVADGWSTAAVGRCPDHRGSADGRRRRYLQHNGERLSSYQVVVVAYSNDLVRTLACGCHPWKLAVFSFA
jgi:hypothetical protein